MFVVKANKMTIKYAKKKNNIASITAFVMWITAPELPPVHVCICDLFIIYPL